MLGSDLLSTICMQLNNQINNACFKYLFTQPLLFIILPVHQNITLQITLYFLQNEGKLNQKGPGFKKKTKVCYDIFERQIICEGKFVR